MRKFEKKSLETVLGLFAEHTKKFPDYHKKPCPSLCDERCGGWIMRDEANMYIGFVDNYGTVDLVDYYTVN
tara:strand:- start:555 stop:767 length:213 start_codon:yes stop_codon:yes gene_type:complete